MHRTLLLTAALALGGCDQGAAVDSGQAVTADAPDARQVDTLLLTLGLITAGDHPVDPGHVVAVALEVDGQPWGRFALEATDATGTAVDGWRQLAAPQTLLLVAHLTDDIDLAEAPPHDVAGWLDVLGRTLPAGDHVARVAEVVLLDADDTRRTLHPTGWTPFRVERGDATALVGDLLFTVTHATTEGE